jgi:TPR repeat protein
MMTLPGGTYPEGTPLTEDGMFAELEEEEEEEQQQQEEEEVEVRTPIMEDVNRSLLHVSSATSLNAMGDRYDRGNGGVQQDRVRALESWVKAASFNCKGAQFSCGQAYALGTDYPQDVPLGMQYLRSAAAQGYDDAIDLIHTMVEVVRGVRGKERCARSAQQVWVPRQMLAWRHPAAPHKLECPVAVAAAAATAPE